MVGLLAGLRPASEMDSVMEFGVKTRRQLTVDVLLDGQVVHGHVVRNGRRVLKDGGVDVLDEPRRRLVEDHDRHSDLLRHEDEVLPPSHAHRRLSSRPD